MKKQNLGVEEWEERHQKNTGPINCEKRADGMNKRQRNKDKDNNWRLKERAAGQRWQSHLQHGGIPAVPGMNNK